MPMTLELPTEIEPNRSLLKGSSRPYHVLLVEDDAEMRRMLAQVLRKHGFRVLEARDGLDRKSVV
jgi:PleD family two-component response regulator